jgi:4-hydroxy-2-oxoheptanedioate aldolase
MIRMPDELESSIQHATDLGVLGIIMPTVDTVEKAQQTAKYARYPPVGRRSSGGGQARAIWGVNGIDYRQTFNDNMLVVAMIETPTGVANAYEIARVPGIDVVIVGNSDMVNFSGLPEEHPLHQQLLTNTRDAVLKAGKFFGMTHENFRSGHPLSKDVKFTQHGPPNDGWTPPAGGRRGGRGAPSKGN